jgi:ubiquinone/menaquinone biosynthesis C-methylase UbiE
MIELGKRHLKDAGMDNRIEFIQGDVEDETFMSSLGKFDLIYSTFSLHHWKNPEQALRLMYQATGQNGTLMIFDFKRVWWLYMHPKRNGFLDSVRASYLSKEIKRMFKNIGIQNFKIRTPFPYFWQIITIQK